MKRCQAETYCNGYPNKCEEYCIGYIQLQNLYELSYIPRRYQFDMPLECPTEDRESYILLRDFQQDIENHIEQGHGLFIHSPRKGNGKTSWACKIANEYAKKVAMTNNLRCRVLFVNIPEFLDKLRNDINAEGQNEELEELKECILTADLVIWDDIGTENPSKWVRQTLYNYINFRESNAKSQIFTSNVSLLDLSAETFLGERVVNRIQGQCKVVSLVGPSRREVNW